MLTMYLSVIDIESEKLDYEKFYRLYKDDVYAYARSLLKTREDAEDASQNTWLWLAKNHKVFRVKDERSVKIYLMRVVRSRAIDIYRKNKRDEDAILCDICEKEDVTVIVSCIKALDEHYRDVLNLYYLNHSSTGEIANILHIKESTARQRLTRGRQKLIALLKERGLRR